MFTELLLMAGAGLVKCLLDDEKKKGSRIGRVATVTEKGIKKATDNLIELQNEVENEKSKMWNYSEETLLKEKRTGSYAHKMAARQLLQENYGYEE